MALFSVSQVVVHNGLRNRFTGLSGLHPQMWITVGEYPNNMYNKVNIKGY